MNGPAPNPAEAPAPPAPSAPEAEAAASTPVAAQGTPVASGLRPDVLVYFQISCGKHLRALFDVLQTTSTRGAFEFSRDEIRFYGVQYDTKDTSRRSFRTLVTFTAIHADLYRYNLDVDVLVVGMDFTSVAHALTKTNDRSQVGFYITRQDLRESSYHVFVEDRSNNRYKETRQINIDLCVAPHEPVDLEYDVVHQISSSDFKDIVSEAKGGGVIQFLSKRFAPQHAYLFHSTMIEEVRSHGCLVSATDDDAPPTHGPVIPHDELDRAKHECDKQECFPVDVLTDVAKAAGVARGMRLGLKRDAPLAAIYNIGTVGQLVFLVDAVFADAPAKLTDYVIGNGAVARGKQSAARDKHQTPLADADLALLNGQRALERFLLGPFDAPPIAPARLPPRQNFQLRRHDHETHDPATAAVGGPTTHLPAPRTRRPRKRRPRRDAENAANDDAADVVSNHATTIAEPSDAAAVTTADAATAGVDLPAPAPAPSSPPAPPPRPRGRPPKTPRAPRRPRIPSLDDIIAKDPTFAVYKATEPYHTPRRVLGGPRGFIATRTSGTHPDIRVFFPTPAEPKPEADGPDEAPAPLPDLETESQ